MNIISRDAEAKLLEVMNSLKNEPSSHYAMHFAFSKLLEHYRSEYQLKIALNILSDIFRQAEGGIYVSKDGDFIIIYKGEDRGLLEKSIFQLRYLFVDDPLAYTSDGDENPDFCSVFDLGFQWRIFYQIAKEKVGIKVKKDGEENAAHGQEKPKPQPILQPAGGMRAIEAAASRLLVPSKLAIIESDLMNADLHLALRRQSICATVKGMELKPVFEEIYINIQHLRRLMGHDTDLTSNKWLFKYLTEILDGYVLDTISRRSSEFLSSPVSINLNIETLLSDKFLRFNSRVDPALKSSIILEIGLADVFMDMAAFLTAKDLAHELGYRICLDGLSALSFTQVDRESLGFDLAKLQWNAEMRSDLSAEHNQKLKEAVKECGSNRIILCRCDSKNALDYGNALGISLFQGRYTDSILNPYAKIIN